MDAARRVELHISWLWAKRDFYIRVTLSQEPNVGIEPTKQDPYEGSSLAQSNRHEMG